MEVGACEMWGRVKCGGGACEIWWWGRVKCMVGGV